MSFSKDTIPDFLSWLLSVLELLIALGIACLIWYVVVCFLSGSAQEERLKHLMQAVNENWKAALIVLIPLFYRPVRYFLENLEEGPAGMKTRKKLPLESKQQATNPPTEKA